MYSTRQVDDQVLILRQRVQDAETQLRDLKLQLQQAEAQAQAAHDLSQAYEGGLPLTGKMNCTLTYVPEPSTAAAASTGNEEPIKHEQPWSWPLTAEDYKRYGRQLIMPEIGLQGQLRLKRARVLLVGVGGLGCPAAAYLAGAGVGTLGLIDGDTVEVSNLHRQVAHSTERVGMSKVDSAIEYLRALNPNPTYIPHRYHLVPQDALALFSAYDLVLDCTDHPTSRYLISDACVLAGRPLVSASALRSEGQLMVLNCPAKAPGAGDGGPCYRCVFPKPPPAESVVSCGEGGILGPVVGVMGVLQALEAIKVIARGALDPVDVDTPMSDGSPNLTTTTSAGPGPGPDPKPAAPPAPPSLLLFSAFTSPPFRTVRLRSRRANCVACSAHAIITADSLTSGSLDYVAFCGATKPVSLLGPEERISATDFATLVSRQEGIEDRVDGGERVLVDVRDATRFELAHLPGSVNIPWSGFADAVAAKEGEGDGDDASSWKGKQVFVVCRLGNDSQLAVRMLKDSGVAGDARDIEGGFRAWRNEVDGEWPDC
ncbi:hypothetical protein H2203_007031 [Taxawa tesnikishii (nom. ined.)]|nr:hypothetical protein H2203_007031 [Dothideales sp. JES 119]